MPSLSRLQCWWTEDKIQAAESSSPAAGGWLPSATDIEKTRYCVRKAHAMDKVSQEARGQEFHPGGIIKLTDRCPIVVSCPPHHTLLYKLEPCGSTRITLMEGSNCFKIFDTPAIVPPVPAPQTKPWRVPRVWFQISVPVADEFPLSVEWNTKRTLSEANVSIHSRSGDQSIGIRNTTSIDNVACPIHGWFLQLN